MGALLAVAAARSVHLHRLKWHVEDAQPVGQLADREAALPVQVAGVEEAAHTGPGSVVKSQPLRELRASLHRQRRRRDQQATQHLAVGETVILLAPHLHPY